MKTEELQSFIGKDVTVTYDKSDCRLYPWYFYKDCTITKIVTGNLIGLKKGFIALKLRRHKYPSFIGKNKIVSIKELNELGIISPLGVESSHLDETLPLTKN